MSHSHSPESVAAKAHRLVQAGQVTWAHGIAVVAGDHGTHVVRRQNGTWTCSCPWGTERPDAKPCSHVLAAALTAPTPPAWPAAPVPVPALPAPSPVCARPARRLPRNLAKHVMVTKTDDPADVAALRAWGNPDVRYGQEDGRWFAVVDEVILNIARRQYDRRCVR